MTAGCKPRVQLLVVAGSGWPHRALHIPLAHATSKIVKRF